MLDALIKMCSSSSSSSGGKGGARWTKEDFVDIKQIGKGQFGTVFVATEKKSNVQVAIKAVKHSHAAYKDAEKLKFLRTQLTREIEIHARLIHPHIIRFYGFFHDKSKLFMVLEFAAKGELYRLLKANKTFSDRRTSWYIAQVLSALIYLHDRSVIHRDIKLENLLIDAYGRIKLADFGWSIHNLKRPSGRPLRVSDRRSTLCGTLDYLAPEMVSGKPHDESIDTWSVGILCYEFLVGKPPFEHSDRKETYKRISQATPTFPEHMSANARDFIKKTLVKNSSERLSARSLKSHPFVARHFENCGDLVRGEIS